MSYGIIYSVTNNLNGKLYIGQTIQSLNTRWRQHVNHSKNGKDPFPKAIYKYGKESFTVKTLCECKNQRDLDDQEIFWGLLLDSLVPNGYNCRLGKGRSIVSDNTRENISKAWSAEKHKNFLKKGKDHIWFGKKHTEETKEKLSQVKMGEKNPNFGKKGKGSAIFGIQRSLETKKKISLAHKGYSPSEETRKKISEGTKGEKNPMYGKTHSDKAKTSIMEKNSKIYYFVSPLGIPVTITNLTRFCRENEDHLDQSSMWRVYRGKNKQHKGWTKGLIPAVVDLLA